MATIPSVQNALNDIGVSDANKEIIDNQLKSTIDGQATVSSVGGTTVISTKTSGDNNSAIFVGASTGSDTVITGTSGTTQIQFKPGGITTVIAPPTTTPQAQPKQFFVDLARISLEQSGVTQDSDLGQKTTLKVNTLVDNLVGTKTNKVVKYVKVTEPTDTVAGSTGATKIVGDGTGDEIAVLNINKSGDLDVSGMKDVGLIGKGKVTISDNLGSNVVADDSDQVIAGGGGSDTIVGGGGNDTISGGAGQDVFKFGFDNAVPQPTTTVISDFELGQDKLDLGFQDRDALKGSYKGATESEDGVTANFSDGQTIFLSGMKLADLSFDMIQFNVII